METLEHPLTYAAASGAREREIFMSTAAPEIACFFQGRFRAPRRAADLLLCLSQVVGSRFHTPAAMVARLMREADPVITCGSDRLRWEGFSACCSAYARVDMNQEALDGALLCQGTTNVDFGPAMRAALTRLSHESACSVSIGRLGLELTAQESVTEKVVALPTRWLRGFLEACYHQLSLKRAFEVEGSEIRRFFQGLPRAASRGPAFVVAAGRGLRLAFTPQPGSLALAGWERLRPLESLLTHAQRLEVFGGPSGASAWVLITADATFSLVLSPDVWRGFSGEGQALWQLSQDWDSTEDEPLLAALGWESRLCPSALAAQSGLPLNRVELALARFAALGLVGYDLRQAAFFRRHLPYRGQLIQSLYPRLGSARQLVESGAVTWKAEAASVQSGDVAYQVTWKDPEWACSCPWFARHGLQRGACKHILAAYLQRGQT